MSSKHRRLRICKSGSERQRKELRVLHSEVRLVVGDVESGWSFSILHFLFRKINFRRHGGFFVYTFKRIFLWCRSLLPAGACTTQADFPLTWLMHNLKQWMTKQGMEKWISKINSYISLKNFYARSRCFFQKISLSNICQKWNGKTFLDNMTIKWKCYLPFWKKNTL